MDQPTNSAQFNTNEPDASPRFQCPVCRARQELQNECRRCGADLSLVVAARRRIGLIQEQLAHATEGSLQHKRLTKELQMLVGTA